MGIILIVLQIASALAFVALMAVQTDRAEQSGVMGLGGQGGRMGGTIEMPVGAERILKPLTKWVAVAFLILSILSSMQASVHSKNANDNLSPLYLVGGIAIYLVIMLVGNRIWDGFVRALGASGS
jgi:protein translocase SecG subunit